MKTLLTFSALAALTIFSVATASAQMNDPIHPYANEWNSLRRGWCGNEILPHRPFRTTPSIGVPTPPHQTPEPFAFPPHRTPEPFFPRGISSPYPPSFPSTAPGNAVDPLRPEPQRFDGRDPASWGGTAGRNPQLQPPRFPRLPDGQPGFGFGNDPFGPPAQPGLLQGVGGFGAHHEAFPTGTPSRRAESDRQPPAGSFPSIGPDDFGGFN